MNLRPCLFSLLSFTVVAAVPTGLAAASIKEREARQQERIAEGVASGQLTPAEAARLEARIAELRRQIAEDRAANGGRLTPEQRRETQKELDELSARIAKQKHDGQTMPPRE